MDKRIKLGLIFSVFLLMIIVNMKPAHAQTASEVTFSVSGIGDDAADQVAVIVDGDAYTVSSLPMTFTWEVNSTHTYTFVEHVYGEATYTWTATAGLCENRTGTITTPERGGYVEGIYGKSEKSIQETIWSIIRTLLLTSPYQWISLFVLIALIAGLSRLSWWAYFISLFILLFFGLWYMTVAETAENFAVATIFIAALLIAIVNALRRMR